VCSRPTAAERLATVAILATMRCARARGDIRSGVTGGLRDGVAEPARRGRAAAGARWAVWAWRRQTCWVGKGRGDVEPAELRVKRRVCVDVLCGSDGLCRVGVRCRRRRQIRLSGSGDSRLRNTGPCDADC